MQYRLEVPTPLPLLQEEAKARTESPNPGSSGNTTRKAQSLCSARGPLHREQRDRHLEGHLPLKLPGPVFCSLQLELYFVMVF